MDKLHWSIDSLIIRDGTCFGFGWIFHEEKEIKDLQLKVRVKNEKFLTITAEIGKPREDVAARFLQFSTALHSGYMFFGSCNQKSEQFGDLYLHGTIADDLTFDLNIQQTGVMDLAPHYMKVDRAVMRQLVTFLKRGLHLLRHGQFACLWEKTKRYLQARPESFLTDTETVQKKLHLTNRQSIVLVIDHDLGGGANSYREQLVSGKIADGDIIFIFSYHVVSLSYMLIVRSKQLNERFAIPGYDFFLKIAKKFEIKEIIYNDGVSFVHPEEIPQLIAKLKKDYNPRLTLLIHDFFIICPSQFLLNHEGVFCGIPDVRRCKICLSRNEQGFSSLFQSRNILQWRSLWGNVIGLADEVRTFSNYTLKLLQKAYPSLDLSRVVVMPHKVEHVKTGPIRPSYTATLRIGVVGQIGFHKGAKVIRELAQEIKNRKIDIQIVIIGTIETQCEKSVIRATGRYKHDQLPSLIERSGANIMLFPSICPETFSYVVQELIELDLPVACFDLGAPAERLLNYPKGLIMKESKSSSILDELISFHQRIYLTN